MHRMIGFALLLLGAVSLAWNTPVLAQEAPAEALTSEVAFEFDGLMFVQTRVNGQGPFKFLFDSGATQSVLNERLAKELGLELHDMPGGIQGVGEAEAKLAVLQSMEIGSFKRGKSVAAILNLDHMSGSLGYHMMGIVGQNVIRHMRKIEIDFQQSTLRMTRYPRGQEPSDFQEQMMIRMLEGGGGMPEIPGLPGLPRRDDRQPDRPREPRQPQEEEFSANPAFGAWLLTGMEDEVTETAPARLPTEGMTLNYRTGTIGMPPLAFELVPYWYFDVELNGSKHTFMFDTGASMLLVLGTPLAEKLRLTTSFSYPVKGIGKGEARSGLVDSLKVGSLTETDVPCTIMDLPQVSGQLGALADNIPEMLRPLLAGLDFDGIIGITLATRYKRMIVNTQEKRIEFVPYGDGEVNELDPLPAQDFITDAVIRTWNGQAGRMSLDGDAVPLDDWKKHGLDSGGLMIESVVEGGAADQAGIRKGDIVTHVLGAAALLPDGLREESEGSDDVEVRDMPGLIIWACTQDPGTEVRLRVKRGDEVLELTLELDPYGWSGKVPERHKR